MCGFHSITSLPHSMFCICPAIVISSHMDEKQSMYRLKRLKERHVGCLLSFTILNIFESNRGLVKILVYSFVFVI